MVTITFQPANKVVQAVVGQNLKDVAAAARIPIKYNCKKGYVQSTPASATDKRATSLIVPTTRPCHDTGSAAPAQWN